MKAHAKTSEKMEHLENIQIKPWKRNKFKQIKYQQNVLYFTSNSPLYR